MSPHHVSVKASRVGTAGMDVWVLMGHGGTMQEPSVTAAPPPARGSCTPASTAAFLAPSALGPAPGPPSRAGPAAESSTTLRVGSQMLRCVPMHGWDPQLCSQPMGTKLSAHVSAVCPGTMHRADQDALKMRFKRAPLQKSQVVHLQPVPLLWGPGGRWAAQGKPPARRAIGKKGKQDAQGWLWWSC